MNYIESDEIFAVELDEEMERVIENIYGIPFFSEDLI